MNSAFNSFSTSKTSFNTSEFLQSNSLIAKMAFLILVLFGFIILLRISITILTHVFSPNESPQLINGMVNASQMITFPQDPSSNGAKTIYRSVNASDGIEFTWSIWINIEEVTFSKNRQYRHIFSKGNQSNNTDGNGIMFPNNAPGLYILPNTNNLVVIMNTFNVINEEVIIPDIPLNKWVNIIIRCQNTTLDVYVNGTITRSINLVGVPKQNYGDVYVALNGGFNGYISNLWYYNYALGTTAIQNIVQKGPNTTLVNGNNGLSKTVSNYLSLRWFIHGTNY